jgi:hypothetical protein
MKIMISRNEQGRALLNTVNGVNLQDLTHSSDDQIKAVVSLVWEIKALFYSLITGKASDVLADLNVGNEAKPTPALVADLTASIPRDVIIRAHQQWLPNLNTEMAGRAKMGVQKRSGLDSVSLVLTATAEDLFRSNARQPNPWLKPKDLANVGEPSGQLILAADDSGGAATIERLPLPNGTPRSIKAAKDAEKLEEGAPNSRSDGPTPSATKQIQPTPPINGAVKAVKPTAESENADAVKTGAVDGSRTLAPQERSQDKAQDQSDDLLLPTEDELRAIKAGIKETGKDGSRDDVAGKTTTDKTKAKADAGVPATAAGTPTEPESATARDVAVLAAGIDNEIDPESWAEYGGWYRQDYTIYYRPTGHKDKFIYSWLFLTGPHAARGDRSPAAAVFNYLTSKEAQGSCTKCHSLDDTQGRGRLVNFAPSSAESKQGRFTHFIHEPHFGIMKNRGCLTCHELEKTRPYLKSYEQGNPQSFVSSFAAVKKDLCQTCHAAGMARQDCLTCHKYHVNGVLTPIISTKNPSP